MTAELKPFIIEHDFTAAPAAVYDALTEPAALGQWMGPKGCKLTVAKLEAHPGGMFHYSMTMPNGVVMWGKWLFRELQPPTRLVVEQSFSDQAGGVTVHPMSPSWPLATLSTTMLMPHGTGTRLRLEWLPLNATPEQIATFDAAHEGMRMGWSGTFEQLAAYLALDDALERR